MDYKELHNDLFVVNAHLDSIMHIVDEDYDYTIGNKKWHSDIPRIKEGGVDLIVLAVYIDEHFKPDSALRRAMEMLDAGNQLIEKSPELELVLTGEDIQRVKDEGKIGVMLALEGADPILNIGTLRNFYRLGIRLMTITWSYSNLLAAGVAEKHGWGLTDFGRECIEEMNRLGMIIDVSHLHPKGFWDIIELSKDPIVASHSNAKAVTDHPRNLTDKQLEAIKDSGGVVGLCYSGNHLKKGGNASIDDIFKHLHHIKETIGIEHIGLGTDFDGIGTPPAGQEDISKNPLITKRLLEEGFGRGEIENIMGQNFVRVIKEVLK